MNTPSKTPAIHLADSSRDVEFSPMRAAAEVLRGLAHDSEVRQRFGDQIEAVIAARVSQFDRR